MFFVLILFLRADRCERSTALTVWFTNCLCNYSGLIH